MQEYGATDVQQATQLLRSIVEQFKSPLTAIARQSELGVLTGDPSTVDLHAINAHAAAAITLADGYLMGLQLLREQATLALEPVSVSSMLTEAAHELHGFAKQYGVGVELHIAGKYAPVLAHPRGLKSALLSIGYVLLENASQENSKLTLAVHRTPHGIVTGLYGNFEDLNAQRWRRALKLHGRAPQPLRAFGSNGAGLFVAEAILQAMSTRLRVGRHLKQQGFATTLRTSQQLRLV